MQHNEPFPKVSHSSAACGRMYRTLEELYQTTAGTEVGRKISSALAQYRDSQADAEVIAKAKELYQNDDCEIDTGALTSEADNGIWVQAWVWIPNSETDE